MGYIQFHCCSCLAIALFCPGIAFGQQQKTAAQKTNAAISSDLLSLYERTQTANSESAMTEIARQCAQVIPNSKRSQADRDYASNLFAWALNRRGEMRNEQAAELVKSGDLDKARTLDQQAAKDFETSIQYSPGNWRTRHNFAISLAMKSDYPRAIEEFTASIELKPDYANSFFNRAELYFELAEYTRAISDYGRAIELNTQDPQYYNSRGHSLFMLESYDEAIDDYRRAVDFGEDSAVYQTDLADAYQFLGRWEEAAKAYRAAVAINSKYARAYQNAAWLMATCPNQKLRNEELALSAAKKVIELEGGPSARSLDTLAAATAALGDHASAVRLQRQAIELMRGSTDTEEKLEMSQRLSLYEQGQRYMQPDFSTGLAKKSAPQPRMRSVAKTSSNSVR